MGLMPLVFKNIISVGMMKNTDVSMNLYNSKKRLSAHIFCNKRGLKKHTAPEVISGIKSMSKFKTLFINLLSSPYIQLRRVCFPTDCKCLLDYKVHLHNTD